MQFLSMLTHDFNHMFFLHVLFMYVCLFRSPIIALFNTIPTGCCTSFVLFYVRRYCKYHAVLFRIFRAPVSVLKSFERRAVGRVAQSV